MGYDIIFINFDEATDYLETNSLLVQEAIKWVNLNKTGSTPNVVLGISMGAVLARHALRTMEVNSIAHNTSLYISMDGAHQGANFPLGLQALVKHINTAEFSLFWGAWPVYRLINMFPELKVAKELFDVPASKQLLYYRIGDGASLPVDNTEHDSFYASYHSLGMPSTRNIAISNGSECGVIQPFAPYATLFEIDSVKPLRLPVLANIIDFFTAPYQVAAGLFTNRPLIGFGSILGVFSTKNAFVAEFKARALPNQTSQEIYKGFFGIKRKILGLFTVNSAITNRSVNALSYMLPLDNGAGGFANLKNGGALGIPPGLSDVVLVPSFNYVPTVSSLDIGNGAATIGTTQLYAGYTRDSPPASPYNTPFANFVTSALGNEDHVTFTSRNGNFLLKELNGITTGFANCAIFCTPTTSFPISGPVVSGGSTTYSISGGPSGTNIQWSVDGGYSIIGSSTASTVLIQLPSSTTQFAQLVATLQNNCGELNIIKNLVPPAITIAFNGNGVCGEAIATINVPSGANFHWTADGDVVINGEDKSVYTTNNSVGIVGINGTVTCTFLSYNNTVTTLVAYTPYQKNVAIAANPMYGSEPLNAFIQDINFGYSAIRWYIDENLNTTGESIYESNLSCGTHTVRVEADLTCGLTVQVASFEVERFCSKSWWENMVIYPNPVMGSNLYVAPDEAKFSKISDEEKSKMKEYEFWLYDYKAKLILKGKSKNLKAELDTKGLPSANYFLHLRMEGEKELIKRQIMIRN